MSATKTIQTEQISARLRDRSIDLAGKRLLVTTFTDSDQEQDLTAPSNCAGAGRIRHFRRETSVGWPYNPLPLDPACAALGIPPVDILRAQVFQNAACNWRCWYCFVPFNLLAANPDHAEWVTASTLISRYLDQPDRPSVIDLTGGQPDLIPEWLPWMMQELQERGLGEHVYLWSDDNLSNDYFWRYLTNADRTLIAGYRNYGRVCCFKGFNRASFTFNTNAEPELFEQQFTLMGRLLETGMDLYAYTTFTAPTAHGIPDDIARFVDKLQAIDRNLPLRTVPLEIQVYSSVAPRMTSLRQEALHNQWLAIESWQYELERRFSPDERAVSIVNVPIGGRS